MKRINAVRDDLWVVTLAVRGGTSLCEEPVYSAMLMMLETAIREGATVHTVNLEPGRDGEPPILHLTGTKQKAKR